MITKLANFLLPQHDKLKHFYLWSIFLALSLMVTNYFFMPNIYAYRLCILTAITTELYQKFIKKGTNSFKEMIMDVFFGGVLPTILHYITTI